MKTCPKCNAAFDDDLSFCLNDGTSLVSDMQALPETVMFTGQQSQVTRVNPPAGSTVPPPSPNQGYQQAQFGQQPPFGQQAYGAQPRAASGGGFPIGKVIAVVGVLAVGFAAILGVGAGLFLYYRTSSKTTISTSANYSISTNDNRSSNNNSTGYSQDPGQGFSKNGFNQVSIEDVSSKGFFPDANKTSAATYDDGSNRVVSFCSVYDTPDAAQSGYAKFLDQLTKDGKTFTDKKTNYAYYNKSGTYSVSFYLENKVYEYNAKNQQALYKFAK